ncbi:hypothetical protein [Desulfosarcina alkanivorans]|uniref:hypothetical protein n=1 Tax=Desulfosarcina alkanivorans TaxID=571177 RepID=UPI00142F1BC6|nr:hypothetical protein [Desulfosarcina alkanivorans]
MDVLVRLPGTGVKIIEFFHKVGDSSCISREQQPTDVVGYPGFNRKPIITIGDLQQGHVKAGRSRSGIS